MKKVALLSEDLNAKAMTTTSGINARINVRALLQQSIIQDGVNRFGGEGNATVSSENFKVFVAMKSNYLVHGLDQFRKR